MNFVKKLYPKHTLSVLDLNADSATVLIARQKDDQSFEVLGAGSSASRGVQGGEITHIGDAVESVVEALGRAQQASGLKVQWLYYNVDDAEMQSVQARGAKFLSGEGEISRADVEQACQTARRLVDQFDRNLVYFKELDFVVDDRDRMANPVGVFGGKLEVLAHALQARSKITEDWLKLTERCQVDKAVPVFIGWSLGYGILPAGDRLRRRLILDASDGLARAIVFENQGVTHYTVVRAKKEEWPGAFVRITAQLLRAYEGMDQVFLTRDASLGDALEASLQKDLGLAVRKSLPLGVDRLSDPKYTAVVGLLHAAAELEKKNQRRHKKSGVLAEVKDRVVSYLNEYF